ncbi:hypothetical protein IVB50_26360 [Bradyrhizobium sp. 87]|nr:hypothetical protein [Bradyrhizobium sp. 87]
MRQGQRFKARLNERQSGQIHCSLLLQQNRPVADFQRRSANVCYDLNSDIRKSSFLVPKSGGKPLALMLLEWNNPSIRAMI